MKQEEVLKLKKLIRELESYKGRHTELISVYIPSGSNIVDVANQLFEERGTASNIKSKGTRKNVLAALEKIIQYLKTFRETPPNGLVIFCGNISPVEGKEDIQLWGFEPPEKLTTKLYWCDQVFVLDPLKEMISEKEIFGLIVLDAREASIGLLEGKKLTPLKHLESTVPSKTVKGGMCLDPDTLIQSADGRVVKVCELTEEDNPIVACDFSSFKTVYAYHNCVVQSKIDSVVQVHTGAPELEVVVSPNHRFFTVSGEGISLKYAKDLKPEDNLFSVKKIKVRTSLPKAELELLSQGNKNRLFLCQLLGYMLGDGCRDNNRIILYDKDKKFLSEYQKIVRKLFGLDAVLRFRSRGKKGSYDLRIYSKKLAESVCNTFRDIFGKNRKIPYTIQKLPDRLLARFVSGLFDAEGYVDSCVGITMSNKDVVRVLQLLLLRFGIISSYHEEKYGKYNKYRLRISDIGSIKRFKKYVNFLSKDKKTRLDKLLNKRSTVTYSNQMPVSGKFILTLAKELKMNTESFPKVQNFFGDKKRQSVRVFRKEVLKYFKKRLNEIENAETNDLKKFRKNLRLTLKEVAERCGCAESTVCDVENGKSNNQLLAKRMKEALITARKELLFKAVNTIELLETINHGDVILTKVKDIKILKRNGRFFDISVPKHKNFIANGIIVHNSQGRYDRLREDAINEFLTKVGEEASRLLLKQEKLVGVIVGGPGPVKEKFVREDYLNYMIRGKVLGVKDIGYADEYGLEELVKRSEDLIKETALAKERKLLKRFFLEISKEGLVAYGEEKIKSALSFGAVDVLLISEEYPSSKAEELIRIAEDTGTKIEFISVDSPEGKEFFRLGGIGALLRFKIA